MKSFLRKTFYLYYDGFRTMTIGKNLWIIIVLKLILFFVVIKLLFFPNFLQKNFSTDQQRSDHVINELTETNK